VLVYASVALSVVRLRARDGYGAAPAARFRMPLAPLMVGVVLAGCGGILATMTLTQGVALAAGLTLGLLLYAGQAYQRRRTAA
jgi:L-asparagine transporter-like permease